MISRLRTWLSSVSSTTQRVQYCEYHTKITLATCNYKKWSNYISPCARPPVQRRRAGKFTLYTIPISIWWHQQELEIFRIKSCFSVSACNVVYTEPTQRFFWAGAGHPPPRIKGPRSAARGPRGSWSFRAAKSRPRLGTCAVTGRETTRPGCDRR